jgi:signal transduction histidine kinase
METTNGVRLDATVTLDHSATRGLRDRLEAIGGRLDVVSVAGAGTTLTAVLPCRKVARA